MKKLSYLVLALVTNFSYSQNLTSTIKGTILDKTSQSPLIGAKVIVLDSDPLIGTITDVNGEFRLENISVGRQSISISLIGYKTEIINNLLVKTAKELDLNLTLIEDLSEFKEIVISGNADIRETNNKMNTVSSRTLSIEEATRFSGSLQDPARMAQNYAGVSGASDDRNDIIIRGNSPTGVLWRMEGVDIPSPNHFSTIGTTGGPVGMLNVNNLSNSDFLTSAWSSEYGNATSGVFDLQLRKGNSDKREHLFQVGFNGFELGAEGPISIKNRMSYIINYRYSTLGVLKNIGIDLGTGSAIPEYQDLTFKVDIPTKKAGVFSLWGIGGFSNIFFDIDTTGEVNNLFNGENQESKFSSKTGVLGLTHKYFFNTNTFSKLSITANATNSGGTINEVDFDSNEKVLFTKNNRTFSRYTAHLKINQKVNAKKSWNGGIIGNVLGINFLDSTQFNGTLIERSNFSGNTGLLQGYIQWRHEFNETTSLNIGTHSEYFTLNNSFIIEPRFGISNQLNEKSKITFGTGLHSQLQPLTIYFTKDPVSLTQNLPNKDLGFTRALHLVLGYEYFIGKNTRIKTEVYYQHIFNVPIDTNSSSFSMLNEGADFVITQNTGMVNKGTGTNMGIELTLEKFLSKGFYYLFTASVFDSKYKGSDGIERNTAFNSQFVLNGLAGKEFNLNKKIVLTVDTKVTTAGGRPYTPVNLLASNNANQEIRDEANAFSDRYKDYFRLDFKVGIRINTNKTTHELSMDLQNLTNNKNIFIQGYNVATAKIGTTYQRGFFPIALYKLYF